MAGARDSNEIEQWIIINQMGAKPRTSDWQARKDFPFFLNLPFSSRYEGTPLHCRRAIHNGRWENGRGTRKGEGRDNDRRGQGEDRTLQEGERVLGASSGLWRIAERRQAMRTIWLLCQATCSYTSMQFLRVAAIYTKANECAQNTMRYACDVCVLQINRVEFQGVNPLFRCVFHVGLWNSFSSARRPLTVKKKI